MRGVRSFAQVMYPGQPSMECPGCEGEGRLEDCYTERYVSCETCGGVGEVVLDEDFLEDEAAA